MPEGLAVFRADASPTMGGGHVMRCLTLADALRDAGWSCAFATAAESSAMVPALARSGHATIDIASDDAGELGACVGHADLLIVDHYGLGAVFEGRARDWAGQVLVIDDLPNRPHDCDLLLDQTAGRGAGDYAGMVPDHCRLLLGADHALLRPQFLSARGSPGCIAIANRPASHDGRD